MSTVQGEVQFIHKNNGGFYNIKVNEEWYGVGKKEPTFPKGSIISFSYSQKGAFKNVVDGTVQVTGGAPAESSAPKVRTGNDKDNYWKEREERDILVQKKIQYQASRNAAIEVAKFLVEQGAIPLGATKNKQMDVFLATVDEITGIFNEKTSAIGTAQAAAVDSTTATRTEEE